MTHDTNQMTDRAFTIAFALSLGLHLFLLMSQFVQWNWLTAARHRTPINVIYDYEIAKQELRHLEEELTRATRETATTLGPSSAGREAQIRIPERPLLATTRSLSETTLGHSSLVDLTNLAEAAHGDPVLLSYFSAIREQIQHTANRRGWVAEEAAKGLVYVSFVLTSNGAIRNVSVMGDRSVSSATLQGIALRIVEAAAPFPPFPPSMTEPRKTIVVPLEFLFGS